MSENLQNITLFTQVVDLLQQSKQQVVRTINQTMVYTYYEIGRMIVEEEQNGKDRAEYGKQLLKGLSKQLNNEFGKGFSVVNLENMRKFYLAYSISETLSRILQIQKSQSLTGELNTKISQSLTGVSENQKVQSLISFFKLTWTHYVFLMRIDDEQERRFYEIESEKYNWSVRELQRQYDSALYTRLALSRDKEGILKLSEKGQIIEKPKDIIKDPYILEFLGLPELHQYSESELEEEIINKLEHFLLELGHGFTFVSRQKRITFDDKHFRIDLVFYNRILKCFVLLDLKIGELKHQDLGQMQMYVNYYDREMRLEDENKTIGIVLCQNKSDLVVEYTLPENNEQIFASKYKTVLPSKEDLLKLIEQV
ncbi:putative nuclease of restriction endonuclease-like (RecB) superfamily [Flavobacterium sp. CG_9.10]|uniref:PDDEXK nuclease domain-containing protein n=1 Tax=Flavobacterium sp. CG_9.10 TaxID=2787729 RepID=UPI0018CBD316|nr:PDDEXK nuclease domain-containing protein [Flavobacterium sp. CG_9.10]MBG6109574.1 putative nuclease of restriction endonuclease-like (RecB) superfamily [Flavobacterium sp. CG_9.10]